MLFLRFLPSLVDESEKIRHLADFLFGNILKGLPCFLFYLLLDFFYLKFEKNCGHTFSFFLGKSSTQVLFLKDLPPFCVICLMLT